MTSLPKWAEDQVPVSMDNAAKLLGICRRTLVYKIKQFPFYEKRGNKKVFYPEHIKMLRECAFESNGKTDGHTLTARVQTESGYDRALKLANQKNLEQKLKRNSGRRVRQGGGNQ